MPPCSSVDLQVDRNQLHVDHKDLQIDRSQIHVDDKELHVDHKDLEVDRNQLHVDDKEFHVSLSRVEARKECCRLQLHNRNARNNSDQVTSDCKQVHTMQRLAMHAMAELAMHTMAALPNGLMLMQKQVD